MNSNSVLLRHGTVQTIVFQSPLGRTTNTGSNMKPLDTRGVSLTVVTATLLGGGGGTKTEGYLRAAICG